MLIHEEFSLAIIIITEVEEDKQFKKHLHKLKQGIHKKKSCIINDLTSLPLAFAMSVDI